MNYEQKIRMFVATLKSINEISNEFDEIVREMPISNKNKRTLEEFISSIYLKSKYAIEYSDIKLSVDVGE